MMIRRISTVKSPKGQSLIELVIAIGLLAIILPAILTAMFTTRLGRAQQAQRIQAVAVLKETQEAVRSIRERDWATFAVNGTYAPTLSGNTWVLATGSATANGFTRQVVISDVYRSPDATGSIVTTGGTLDPSTKKIVTTVTWGLPFVASIDSTMYLTRFLENNAYIETTENQFNFVGSTRPGVKTGVGVQDTLPASVTGDGEVVLGSGGNSNWCSPSLVTNVLDLPGSGYASAITAIEGKAFAGTGENSSGMAFMAINISNAQPPVPSMGSTFDGYKTNGVFGETNYGYITTDTNSKELVILDISGSSYTEIGYFNAPGNGAGDGIFVMGNVGYMTSGNKLYNFNLTSKSGSRSALDSDGVTLAGNGTDIFVVGSYAYITTDNASNELQIVDISNTSNLTVVGQANTDSQAGVDVFVDTAGTRAYLATAVSSTKNELFIINVATKTGNRTIVGSYNSNPNSYGDMNPKGITVVPGNRAILVGQNGREYQVINISSETSPVYCGGVEVNTSVHSVASVLEADGDAYSYIVTGDSSSELKIVAGGAGGGYTTAGTFESQTFDAIILTANNRFSATYSEPANTEIKFQVAMATKVSGSCPTTGNYTFVGPGLLTTTYFEPESGTPITFPFGTLASYTNPGHCFRYKAFLSNTDSSSSPVLNDVTINYSP